MPYRKESEMYPDVQKWFHVFLSNRFKRATVRVYDTSKKVLSKFLSDNKLHTFFPDYQTYEVEVDILGIVIESTTASLAFVECKINRITLRDLSQLLGYSKVAKPLISIILSPKGSSDGIHLLFNVHRRNDILYYGKDKFIHIAEWLPNKQDINYSRIIPKGSSL